MDDKILKKKEEKYTREEKEAKTREEKRVGSGKRGKSYTYDGSKRKLL